MTRQQQFGFINIIPYPDGILRRIVRMPLWFYKMGMGDLLYPMSLLVLTTRGRKSGLPRHHVLEYRRHGSKLYVISGWGDRPHWVRNLMSDPQVTVQIGQREISGRARIVEDSAEALRALYMFQRTGRLYEAILADMSSADNVDLRTLKQVASEFTVIRVDLHPAVTPSLAGIRPRQQWLLPAMMAFGLVALIGMVWMVGKRDMQTNRDRE